MKHPKIYIFLVLLIILFVFIHNSLTPVFFSMAESEAIRIANKAINQAVDQEIESLDYSDLVNYKLDNNGNIILMQPNTKAVNQFSSRVSLNVQSRLKNIEDVKVSIPLMRILGIDLLAAVGPRINARILPVGFTQPPQVNDSIESAGINQTRHKIYLKIGVKLKLIVPFAQKVTTVQSTVPVIEVTILGRVPEIYVGLDEGGLSGLIKNKTE